MTGTGRLTEVRAVIESLEGLSAAERDREIDKRCAGDPGLRAEVVALLAEMDSDDGFLTPPVPDAASRAYEDFARPSALPERAFPGFRVLRVLGEGGMGVIYEAEQERPRRRVALKVMRSALPTEELRRRFVLESEVLGRLQHPGIARIYEAGTYGDDGRERPFFAMEYIEGETLTAYARNAGLDARGRVALVIKICEALEHAHQKGVIHRDLKPANILVGGDGLPKVLDFGVARSIDAESPVTAVGTSDGQIVGTLAYMSPEQLSGDPGSVDTRSDVYALGVLAYELFAGRRPFDLTGRSFPDAIRAVQHETPPALGTIDREMRGDLSTIVHKAMDKDAARRYPSASLLAVDLERFLNNEPIEARAPTTMYRVQKFTARNPVLVGGLATVFAVLVSGIIATSATAAWALDAEADARASAEAARVSAEAAATSAAEAEQEAAIADAVNDFLNKDLLAAVNPENTADPEITMREVLDIASENIEGRFPDQPLVEARVRLTLSQTYQGLGELDEAERHGRISLDLLRAHTPMGDRDTVSYAVSFASTLMYRGRYDEARQILEPLTEERLKASGPLDELYLMSATNLASAYMRLGRHQDAEPLLLETLENKRQALGELHVSTLISVNLLGNLYSMLAQVERAHEYFELAYNGRRDTLGEKHPRTLTAMTAVASQLIQLERHDEARDLLARCRATAEEVLGSKHPQTFGIANTQSMNERGAGRHDAALAFADEAIAIADVVFGPDNPRTLDIQLNRAEALRALGRQREALPVLAMIEAREAETLPANHYFRAITMVAHARSLRDTGQLDKAESRARAAFCIYAHNFGPDDHRRAEAAELVLEIVRLRGNEAEAESVSEAISAGSLRALLCGED
jgi:tetratricopeptide (TPR) repeat protein/predicted Ser/Thr protein kinase